MNPYRESSPVPPLSSEEERSIFSRLLEGAVGDVVYVRSDQFVELFSDPLFHRLSSVRDDGQVTAAGKVWTVLGSTFAEPIYGRLARALYASHAKLDWVLK